MRVDEARVEASRTDSEQLFQAPDRADRVGGRGWYEDESTPCVGFRSTGTQARSGGVVKYQGSRPLARRTPRLSHPHRSPLAPPPKQYKTPRSGRTASFADRIPWTVFLSPRSGWCYPAATQAHASAAGHSDRKAGDAGLWLEIRQLEATLYLREKGSRFRSATILALAEQSH